MKSATLPLRKARVTWPRLDCLKPNPGRIMRSPAAALTNDGASPVACLAFAGHAPGGQDTWR